MAKSRSRRNVPDLALIGDVDEWEADAIKAMLEVPEKGEIKLYLDSAGGSVYGATAVVTLMQIRQLRATGIVLGECSSAAILVFAACKRRLVTPRSTFLFHRMRWQSDKRVGAAEAGHWARHFEQLEAELDQWLAQLLGVSLPKLAQWVRDGQYLTGREMVEAKVAELLEA